MKYCEKHNFEYMDFLSQCPLCRGEAMVWPECHTIPHSNPDYFNKVYQNQPLHTVTTLPNNTFKRRIAPQVGDNLPPVFKRTEKPVKTVPPKGYLF